MTCIRCGQPFVTWHEVATVRGPSKGRATVCSDCEVPVSAGVLDLVALISDKRYGRRLIEGVRMAGERLTA
jgi:DNA-directed RNA polymerase subunit RPC12/RpoP